MGESTYLKSSILLLLILHIAYGDYSINPYLNGEYVNDYRPAFNAEPEPYYMDLTNNPFLSHMIQSRAIPGYAGPQYLPPVTTKTCSPGQSCVNANLCVGGYFTQGSPSGKQQCDIDNEVCCTYRPPPTQPPPTRPPPTQRPSTPCSGNDVACVPPNLCQNGRISQSGFRKTSASNNCYAPEVCCRIPEGGTGVNGGYVVPVPTNPLPTPPRVVPTRPPPPRPTQPRRVTTVGPSYLPPVMMGEDQLSLPIQPPTQCAAAMNCTPIEFCDATGYISKSQVTLSPDQEAFRVPLTDCMDAARGFTGKCCRDPDYTDPWPTGMLGKYDASIFGEKRTARRGAGNPGQNRVVRSQIKTSNRIVRSQSKNVPITSTIPTFQNQIIPQVQKYNKVEQCATRDFNASPKGPGPIDAAFGEYPWQAMVLLDSTKSLLCGGAIIRDDVVATAAHCVRGRKTFDVVVKGGEWKLGSNEEPLKFQIIRVRRIETHPQNDLALLMLDTKFHFDRHIAQICVDDIPPTPSDECMTTGWGKEALRIHLQDAIMHHSQVNIYPVDQQSNVIYGQSVEDACEVDPGSALACKNSEGNYVLKGLNSREESCGSSLIEFSVPDLEWINSILNGGYKKRNKLNKQITPVYNVPTSAPIENDQQTYISQADYNQAQSFYEPVQYSNPYEQYYPDYTNYYRQY